MGIQMNGIRMESQDDDDEDGTGALIADLVAQGADLQAVTDMTGESPLHLAARYVSDRICGFAKTLYQVNRGINGFILRQAGQSGCCKTIIRLGS